MKKSWDSGSLCWMDYMPDKNFLCGDDFCQRSQQIGTQIHGLELGQKDQSVGSFQDRPVQPVF